MSLALEATREAGAPGAAEAVPPGRRSRWGPWLLVAAAVAYGLFSLRNELRGASYNNDAAVHLSMVRWARARIQAGHLPVDGWYPFLSLGLPQFHHYQSLAHILTAYAGLAIGTGTAFRLAGYLLMALWPVSVYLGTRLLGWEARPAALAAAISPLIVSVTGYGPEVSSYLWTGLGLWSQEWGLFLLPVALGLSWRAVRGKGRWSLALGALAVGFTIALHFLTGYLALLCVGVWAVLERRGVARRAARAVVVALGALLCVSWVVVPLLVDSRWANRSIYGVHTFWFDSFGTRTVLSWLFTGRIYDASRPPVITVLVAIGIGVCASRWRRDPRARAVLALWGVSLLLFFGRPALGPLLVLLPGTGDMMLHRYIMGVHVAGLLMAGIGVSWLVEVARPRLARLRLPARLASQQGIAAAGPFACLTLFLAPAWWQVSAADHIGASRIAAQQVADRTDGADVDALVRMAAARGPGRIYAGLPTNWGKDYKVGYVSMDQVLAAEEVDAIGYTFRTESLSTDVEAYFDETNPAQYDLFDVRYLLLPASMNPPVRATLLAHRGRHSLWEVATSGYIGVIDTAGSIAADRTTMAAAMVPVLRSGGLARGILPTVAFAGSPAAPGTLPAGASPAGPPGSVDDQQARITDGAFTAGVTLARRCVVVLKSTFDPRWAVTVDGRASPPIMVAPSLVGVVVGPGHHRVAFQYRQFPGYAWLFALGALTILALAAGGRRVRALRLPA